MANVLIKYPPPSPPGKNISRGPRPQFFYRYVLPYRGPGRTAGRQDGRTAGRQDGRTDGQGRREGQGRGAGQGRREGQGRRAGGRKGRGKRQQKAAFRSTGGKREICFDALVFAIWAGIFL